MDQHTPRTASDTELLSTLSELGREVTSVLNLDELLAKIPARQLTTPLRLAAFKLAPKSLLQLPMQFDLQREYEACFLALDNPQTYAAEIPAQFMSEEIGRAHV